MPSTPHAPRGGAPAGDTPAAGSAHVADVPAASRRCRLVHAALAATARRGGPVEKEILGLGEVVGPGAVCVDVGAEFGLYTHVLADLVGPTGRIHAVEPQRGAHRALRAGLSAAGLDQVRLHRLALGATDGHGELSVPRRAGLPVHGRAFLTTGAVDEGPNREFSARRREAVVVTTLDAVAPRWAPDRLDLVKIDVEGAEAALLDGAEQTLRRHRPHLLIELEDRHTRKYGVRAQDVFGRLVALGYRASAWNAGWRPVGGVGHAERNYLFRP